MKSADLTQLITSAAVKNKETAFFKAIRKIVRKENKRLELRIDSDLDDQLSAFIQGLDCKIGDELIDINQEIHKLSSEISACHQMLLNINEEIKRFKEDKNPESSEETLSVEK